MRGIMKGAAAGAAATVPMTIVMEKLHEMLPSEPARPLPPREVVEALAEKAGVAHDMDETAMANVTLGAHVGYGALCGALFGLIAPKHPGTAIAAGMLFGLGVWAGSYLGFLPALDLRHDAREDPPVRNGLMIASHLVWGAATGYELASPRGEEHA